MLSEVAPRTSSVSKTLIPQRDITCGVPGAQKGSERGSRIQVTAPRYETLILGEFRGEFRGHNTKLTGSARQLSALL